MRVPAAHCKRPVLYYMAFTSQLSAILPLTTCMASTVSGTYNSYILEDTRRLQESIATRVGVTNLASTHVTNPLSSTTAGSTSQFTGCGSSAGHTRKFFVMLSPGITITIGQTSNTFDSEQSISWTYRPDRQP